MLIAFIAFCAYLPTVADRNLTDCGGSSRMATVESLVERGTFAINGSTFDYTCDVLTIGEKLYSDKPPLLSFLSAGIYAVLHYLLGLSFEPLANPYLNRIQDHTYGLMTILVVVVAQALLVATFDRASGELGLAGWRRIVATASAAFATLLWPLSVVFNPHTVSALLLFAGIRWMWVADPSHPVLAGLVIGFAAALEPPLGLVALALAATMGPGRSRVLLGSLTPLAMHAFLNWWIVGDLVPFQMHREFYNVQTGHFGSHATGFPQMGSLAFYAARNLIGSIGVFSITPLAGLALVLAIGHMLSGGKAARLAFFSVSLFGAMLVIFVAIWPDAVGCSYGMRHLAPTLPVLLLVAAVSASSLWTWRAYIFFGILSAVLAAGGLLNPAACEGFLLDERGYIPARVFYWNVWHILVPWICEVLGISH